MYSQFQKQSLDLGKQFAEQAYKAQVAALKGFAEIQSLQVKALGIAQKTAEQFGDLTRNSMKAANEAAAAPAKKAR